MTISRPALLVVQLNQQDKDMGRPVCPLGLQPVYRLAIAPGKASYLESADTARTCVCTMDQLLSSGVSASALIGSSVGPKIRLLDLLCVITVTKYGSCCETG